MKDNRLYLLTFSLITFFATALSAQAEFGLQLQPDGKTYTAHIRSQTDWLPPLDNLVHTAKLTIVVPHGGLEVSNFQSQLGQWELTHFIQQPNENPGADYFLFEMIAATADASFYKDQPVQLFSFENTNGCLGAFELMDMATDPFVMPNSLNIPVGQSMVVEGAGAETYTGNYTQGAADCMAFQDCELKYRLELQPNNFYKITLLAGFGIPDTASLYSLRMAVKVPTNFFKLHELENLQAGDLAFLGVSRYDAPLEEPGFDYIQINMVGSGGQPIPLTPGEEYPIVQFSNGGSCQGDSIFMVKNSGDPFLQPNSQNANIGQQVWLANDPFPKPICIAGNGAAQCKGCLFLDDAISINDIIADGPLVCLGQTDGSIQINADGADDLEFSIDGGQSWQSDPLFNDLPIDTYVPSVKGLYYGCPVQKVASPILLEAATEIELELGMLDKACKGDDLALQVVSPINMPLSTSYSWSGPMGFSATIPDPVLFNVNTFQTGNYTLTVNVPGCDETTAITPVEVVEPAETPTLISNAPICEGEALILGTDVLGDKYEWIGPIGQSSNILALPGLTTDIGTTILQKGHPAYQGGAWKIRLTDSNGCIVESTEKPVTVKNRPQAFASNNGPVCLGKDAQLSAVPITNAIYRWQRLGDSTLYSFLQEPMLSNVTSTETFTLEVEVDGCVSENTAITTVGLHPKPAAFPIFDYQLASDCSPEDIQLSANATGMGLTYQWSGTNGFSSQVENPMIANANSQSNGAYQLTVTNIHGCSAISPFEINGVVGAVQAPIVQSSGAACPGEDVQLSVSSYNNPQVSYQWFKNGNLLSGATSNLLNLNAVQNSNAGMYHVEIQVDACEVSSADMLLEILQPPAAQPNFVLAFPCEGSSLQFFSNTSGIVNWHWTGPNGFTSDSSTPLIYNTEFDDVGAYTLTVTAANGCSASNSILVDGILPVPDPPQVASNSPVCPEDEIVLVVQNPTLLGTVFYEWVNGLGIPVGTGDEMLQMDPSDPLAFPPFLVKKNVNGCASELSDPIPVEIKPLPVAEAENGGSVCPGNSAQLFAAPAPGATYTWRKSGQQQVISFEQNPQLAINDTTEFELTVKTTGCDSEAKDYTTIFTKTQPIISDLSGGGSYCEGSPVVLSGSNEASLQGSVSYTWTGPNGFSYSGNADPSGSFDMTIGVMQVQNEGAYTLQLESSEGCISTPQSIVVDFVEMPQPPQLTLSSNTFCQGETLQLNASAYSGNVQYQWFFNDGTTDILLGTTVVPTYFVSPLTPSNSGIYFVKINVDGCEPPASNLQAVNVLGIGSNVAVTNSTEATSPACEGNLVQLDATLIPGATYNWFGPMGFQSGSNAPVITNVQTGQSGNYTVNISLPGCTTILSEFTTVFVTPKPAQPILDGSSEVCVGGDAIFQITNPVPGATYGFYFSQNNTLIETGSVPSFNLENILLGQAGTYYAISDLNDCLSEPSSLFTLEVVESEEIQAFAGEDQMICNSDELVFLSGNTPAIGVGKWRALNNGFLVQPNEPLTEAKSLFPGSNFFIWEITHPICDYESTDTTTIFFENINAIADEVTLNMSDTFAVIDILFNDEIATQEELDIRIIGIPEKGEALIGPEKRIIYRPYPNVLGEDQFTYRICSTSCPDKCSSAKVNLQIGSGNIKSSECFVPNLISPNGDGENENFIIPCTNIFPGSSLVVYNRYGSPVYESKNYQNDWSGTYNGEPMPAGTYFYQLSLNDGAGTMLQGYIAVLR